MSKTSAGAPLITGSVAGAEAAIDKPRRGRFRFRITVEGFVLLIFMVLVGFAAWHSGTNLLYLVFAILVAVYLLHGFVLSVNLSRLAVTEQVPSMAVAGQQFDVTISVQNKKRWFSSHSIRVSHLAQDTKDLVGAVHVFQVTPNSKVEATYSTIVNRRGVFQIGGLSVSTRYPFGFEERSQLYGKALEVLVLPQTYPVSSMMALMPAGLGDQESNVRGSGTDLYGLRQYVEGEPARHVHWRTSARAQKLMIAEYTREERRQTMLILDNAAPAESHPALAEAFENAITLTASLAKNLMESGFEVGLITQERRIEPGQGNSRLTEILRVLALIQLRDAKALPATIQGARVIFGADNGKDYGPNNLVIDSTAWQPPQDSAYAGEKYL